MLKRILSILLVAVFINTCGYSTAFAQDNTIPQLNSETAVLMDASTGQALFEKQMNQRMYPASITKIMTALVALEKGNLSDTITMSENAVFSIPRDSSHIALDVGEQLTLEQALYAMLVESANDAANGIAEHIGGGSIDEFVKMMNEKAQQIGAVNTHFVNPHGLHDDNHYTTAYDMALITRQALKNERFKEMAGMVKYTMAPTNKQANERYLNNRNYLLNPTYKYDGAYCGKNGWTNQAKNTLVTCAKKNDRDLIAVVMKATTIDNTFFDTIKLFDYGFDQFKAVTIPKEKITVPAFKVVDAKNNNYEVQAYLNDNFTLLVHNSLAESDISFNIEYPSQQALDALKDLKVKFTVPSDNIYMYSVLGEFDLMSNAKQVLDVTNGGKTNKQNISPIKQVINFILSFLMYAFITFAVIFVVLLIIRYINLSRRKKRRRR